MIFQHFAWQQVQVYTSSSECTTLQDIILLERNCIVINLFQKQTEDHNRYIRSQLQK